MTNSLGKTLHETLVAAGIAVESVRQTEDGAWELIGVSDADRPRAEEIAAQFQPSAADLIEQAAGRIDPSRLATALALLTEEPQDTWAKGVVAQAVTKIKAARRG